MSLMCISHRQKFDFELLLHSTNGTDALSSEFLSNALLSLASFLQKFRSAMILCVLCMFVCDHTSRSRYRIVYSVSDVSKVPTVHVASSDVTADVDVYSYPRVGTESMICRVKFSKHRVASACIYGHAHFSDRMLTISKDGWKCLKPAFAQNPEFVRLDAELSLVLVPESIHLYVSYVSDITKFQVAKVYFQNHTILVINRYQKQSEAVYFLCSTKWMLYRSFSKQALWSFIVCD